MTATHTVGDEARREILRAWTERLYAEYENVLYHFGVRLATPVIRIDTLSGSWGQWSAAARTLTLSRTLVEQYSWDVVIEVLKHEMAHQLVTDRLGGQDLHGPVFRQACRMLGVAEWAAAASGELPSEIPSWREKQLSDEEERLLKRAEKLLALAESANEHEAALAMQRVRQLYAKYNLERLDARREPAHVYCVIDNKQKRIASDESMIFSILNEHFFVRAIYTSLYDAKDLCAYKVVELHGTRENVLMAEYVYHFLKTRLDSLWRDYRRRPGKTGLAGAKARRSYRLGVLSGFRDKLAQTPAVETTAGAESTSPAQTKALLALADRQLDEFIAARHPRLSTRKWGSGYGDRDSFAAGKADGRALNLHRGLTHTGGNRGLRLPAGGGK